MQIWNSCKSWKRCQYFTLVMACKMTIPKRRSLVLPKSSWRLLSLGLSGQCLFLQTSIWSTSVTQCARRPAFRPVLLDAALVNTIKTSRCTTGSQAIVTLVVRSTASLPALSLAVQIQRRRWPKHGIIPTSNTLTQDAIHCVRKTAFPLVRKHAAYTSRQYTNLIVILYVKRIVYRLVR